MDGKLVINSQEAEIVRLIFQILAASASLAKVRLELNARGAKTRSGNNWSKTSIDNVLRNPAYTGKLRYHGKTYPGQHEGIIEEALFYKVQGLHKTQTHVSTRQKRTYLLRGLLRCADCGSMMTPHYTKKKNKDGYKNYFYYRCSKTMHHDKTICKIRQIGAEEVEPPGPQGPAGLGIDPSTGNLLAADGNFTGDVGVGGQLFGTQINASNGFFTEGSVAATYQRQLPGRRPNRGRQPDRHQRNRLFQRREH